MVKEYVQLKSPLDVFYDWRNPQQKAEIDLWWESTRHVREFNSGIPILFGKRNSQGKIVVSRRCFPGVYPHPYYEGQCIFWLDYWMHQNNIFVFSEQYPQGAIRDLNAFVHVMAKKKAWDSFQQVLDDQIAGIEKSTNSPTPKKPKFDESKKAWLF